MTELKFTIWERAVGAKLREEEMICGQYGFMPGKSTTDAMFALRVLMESIEKARSSCIVCLWI